MYSTYYKYGPCYIRCQQGEYSVIFGATDAEIRDLLTALNEGCGEDYDAAMERLEGREVAEPPMPVVDVVIDFLDAKGFEYSDYKVTTGSIYITVVDANDASVVIRIADHDECYPPDRHTIAQITIDRDETDRAAIEKAVAAVIAKIGYTL